MLLPAGTEGMAINIGAEAMHLIVAFRSEALSAGVGPSPAS
jgi:hypothetical protein